MSLEENDVETRARARLGSMIRGKYRLDRVLGTGGMAVVYSATHRNQKQFAVKMLHAEFSVHPGIRSRFLREGYVANSFKHAGAVAVLDDDIAEDGSAFLVMELLEGDDLDHIAQHNGYRLPVAATLAVGFQLLDVLEAAHRKGIVHRDIKPANLFLADAGTIKVLDFGIARVRDALATGSKATAHGTLLGTPGFMAPEQALGNTDSIDGTTDIWAAGATMFALLTGQAAHLGSTTPELIVAAATQPARRLLEVAPWLPPSVADLLDRALAFDKARRWPTAAAMRDAIGAVYQSLYGQPLSKAPLAPFLVPSKTSGHHVAADTALGAPPPEPSRRAPGKALGTLLMGGGDLNAAPAPPLQQRTELLPATVRAPQPSSPDLPPASPPAPPRSSTLVMPPSAPPQVRLRSSPDLAALVAPAAARVESSVQTVVTRAPTGGSLYVLPGVQGRKRAERIAIAGLLVAVACGAVFALRASSAATTSATPAIGSASPTLRTTRDRTAAPE